MHRRTDLSEACEAVDIADELEHAGRHRRLQLQRRTVGELGLPLTGAPLEELIKGVIALDIPGVPPRVQPARS
jgi:hypothetical protein